MSQTTPPTLPGPSVPPGPSASSAPSVRAVPHASSAASQSTPNASLSTVNTSSTPKSSLVDRPVETHTSSSRRATVSKTLGAAPLDDSRDSSSASASASASGSGGGSGGPGGSTRFRRHGSNPTRLPRQPLSIDTAGTGTQTHTQTQAQAAFGGNTYTGDTTQPPLGSRIPIPTTKISKSDDERDRDDHHTLHGHQHHQHQHTHAHPHPHPNGSNTNADKRVGGVGIGGVSDETVVVSPAEHSRPATTTRRKKTLKMSGDLGRQGGGGVVVVGGGGAAAGAHGHDVIGDVGATTQPASLSHDANTSHVPTTGSYTASPPLRDTAPTHPPHQHGLGSAFQPGNPASKGWNLHARTESLSSEDDDEGSYTKSWWGGSSNPYEAVSVSPKMPMRRTTSSRMFPPVIDQALSFLGLDVRKATRAARKSSSDLNRSIHGFTRRRDDTMLGKLMPFVPTRLSSIGAFLLCLALFAASLTVALKYILNPDKGPLPWRQYCLKEYPTLYSLQDPAHPNEPSRYSNHLALAPLTHEHPAWPFGEHKERPYSTEPHSDLSELDPVGVFVGVFTMDSGAERRHLIRQSYMSHWRSRPRGTEGVRVRFVMGRPRDAYAKLVASEQEAFGDIVILDMPENMNSGKTHKFFTWASQNAMVPHYEYPSSSLPIFKGERRPNYVLKADDDAFIMLGELERHLRAAPRKKAFWGYLVKNLFMGGECYGLSIDLVDYIASSMPIRSMTRGKEDKLVAKWIKMHPEKESIVWVTEKCWIYDTPQAGTVYSHGYLFPSQVKQIRHENATGLSPSTLAIRGGKEHADEYSSVMRFQYYGFKYAPVRLGMTPAETIEGMIEGSPVSNLRDYNLDGSSPPSTPPSLRTLRDAYDAKLSRQSLFVGDEEERGGTVLVHFVKKTDWFLQTMAAMLGPMEEADLWKGRGSGRIARNARDGQEGEGEQEKGEEGDDTE